MRGQHYAFVVMIVFDYMADGNGIEGLRGLGLGCGAYKEWQVARMASTADGEQDENDYYDDEMPFVARHVAM